MPTYPSESFFRSNIRQSIETTTLPPITLKVTKVPTLTSGLLTISPNTVNEEIVEYSAIDGTNLTITVSKRGIKPSSQALTTDGAGAASGDYNNSIYMKEHTQNDQIRADVNHLHVTGFATIGEDNSFAGDNVFTNSIRIPVYANATARDTAITSPSNGMSCYSTADGAFYDYVAGAWTTRAFGAVVNASTTVAGKLEVATDAEALTETDTGGTGATLLMTPSQIQTLGRFGDGSDGNVTISVNTTLTRDMYYNNLTINTGVELNTGGYAIYVLGTLTRTGTAKIVRNGNNGGNASGATGGAAGAALTSYCGLVLGGQAGRNGIVGVGASGNSGVSVDPSYATTGTTGATGGTGGATASATAGGSAGTGGTATQGILYNKVWSAWEVISYLASPGRGLPVYYGMPSSAGGAAGGGDIGQSGGGGGGSGGNGGNILIFANILSGTGTIESKGGNGGTGANGSSNSGNGGGGAGGCGGIVVLVYRSGTVGTITLTGGAGGAAGTGGGGGGGTAGGTGTVGQSIIIAV